MQRPGGIRRHELDHDPLAGMRARPSEGVAFGQHACDDRLACGMRDKNVDESGARNFGAIDDARCGKRSDQRLREFARIALGALRQRQRDVRRVVAMRGLLGPVKTDGRVRELRHDHAHRVTDDLFQVLLEVDHARASSGGVAMPQSRKL